MRINLRYEISDTVFRELDLSDETISQTCTSIAEMENDEMGWWSRVWSTARCGYIAMLIQLCYESA